MELSAFEVTKFLYAWLLLSSALIVSKSWIFGASGNGDSKSKRFKWRAFFAIFLVLMFVASTDDLVAGAILGVSGS